MDCNSDDMEEYKKWDNIKVDLKKIDVDMTNWTELAQDETILMHLWGRENIPLFLKTMCPGSNLGAGKKFSFKYC